MGSGHCRVNRKGDRLFFLVIFVLLIAHYLQLSTAYGYSSEVPENTDSLALARANQERLVVGSGSIPLTPIATATETSSEFPAGPPQQRSSPTKSSPQSFNRLMTQAHRLVAQAQWEAAVQVLQQAVQLRPNSRAANDLLKQAQLLSAQEQRKTAIGKFNDALHTEDWVTAVNLSSSIDTPSHEVSLNIERAKHLNLLEQEVNRLLEQPELLARSSGQQSFKRVLSTNNSLDAGERIQSKIAQLNELNVVWTQPIQVKLKSDRRSSVLIRPGKELGKFQSLTIELLPGEYRLIARRTGFREVSQPIILQPGDEPRTFDIRTKDRF